jgi:hypothetical protein
MLRFILGAIVGGVAVWAWRDELREYMAEGTRSLRTTAADQLEAVRTATEGALNTARDRISSSLESGQDAIRPEDASRPAR